MDSPWPHTSYY